jgi:ATP phosphoribosyltransferase
MSLRIAMARGTPFAPAVELLGATGVPVDPLREDSRRLVFTLADGTTVLTVRPTDVPVYVELGAADIGIAGKDLLLEQRRELYELLDLGIAPCRLMYASPRGAARRRVERLGRLRVATKYPHVAHRYFAETGRQVQVVTLHGSLELAPLVGLADGIVDLVSSGATLRVNGLVEREEIALCSQRLIANRAAHKLLGDEIGELSEKLRALAVTA